VSHSPLAEREWGLGEGDQIGPSAAAGHPRPRQADRWSSAGAMPSGSGSRAARIHTSCAVVSAPTFDRAFARWCFTVECDRPRRWAAALSLGTSAMWVALAGRVVAG
jgi:hypothetical protein